jgi:subtilisin family serine protease
MRRCFSVLVGFAILSSISSQGQKMSAYTQHSLYEIQNEITYSGKCDCSAWPVYTIQGKQYLSLFGKLNQNPDWNSMHPSALILGSRIGDIQTLKVDIQYLDEINWHTVFQYLEVPDRVQPHLNRVREDLSIDSIHAGVGLPSGLDGEGVIVGVTDWGFDYTHPMFYDSLNGHTRIIAAWDQYRQNGDTPQDFDYGVEFNTESELLSALGDTANIYSYGTHGTHVAGIAGGSGAGTDYIGMAPMCNFLFATFLIDAASVIDAYTWMKGIADTQNKRLVINQSWGLLYMGTLDGNSLLSQAIDALSAQGVVFSSSAGNNGDANFHISHEFNQDTTISRVQFDSYASYPTMWGQSITLWGEQGNSFEARLSVHANNYSELNSTEWINTGSATGYDEGILIVNSDTVFYNITVDSAFALNGRPHMRIRVRNTNTAYRIGLNLTAAAGIVHGWNVIELVNGVGNWGLPFITMGNVGLSGNSEYGISEPACTGSAISVAAYSARYTTPAGSLMGGSIASFTSSGPLITGAMKPDIAAPGVNVGSSISAWTDDATGSIESVDFQGQTYTFARFSGTSMSAPCVSGVCALLLQQSPDLSPYDLKERLMSTARVDEFTGPISAPGDVRWGMGKVNPYQIVLDHALSNNEIQSLDYPSSIIYPNPSNGRWKFESIEDDELISVQVFDISGRSIDVQRVGNFYEMNCADGLYFVRAVTKMARAELYRTFPLIVNHRD